MHATGLSEDVFKSFINNLPAVYKTVPHEEYGAQYYINGQLIAEYGYGHGQSYRVIYEENLITHFPCNEDFYGSLHCFWDSKRHHNVVERERGANLQLHFHKNGTVKRVLYRSRHTKYRWKEGAIYHRTALSLLADYKKWSSQ